MELMLEQKNGIATIRLNRPDSLNALTPSLQFDLLHMVEKLAADDAVKCIMLTGTGRAFCAGGDVKAMADIQTQSLDEQAADLLARQQLVKVLREAPKVSIAAVNGLAMGMGLALVLACDFRIAADTAKFGAAYAKVGLTGDFGISWLLQQEVGASRARLMLLSADPIDAGTALAFGIANKVVPDDVLASTAENFGRHYANGPMLAYAAMKRNLLAAAQMPLDEVLTLEARELVAAKQSRDHKEAIAAFAAKRPPLFIGK